MKVISVIALLAFVGLCHADANDTTITCAPDMWGADCTNVCGHCNPVGESTDRKCNVNTGACASGCASGWVLDEPELCTEPECPKGCGPGICVAPGYCAACGDINYVSPDCHDIRPGGLVGSLVALIVISCSIAFCNFGSKWYNKKQAKRSSLSL